MNYRIEKKNAFRIIGISEKLSKNMEENFTILPKVWKKAAKNGTLKKIVKHIGEDLKGVLGVSVCGDSSEWKYFIAAANETTCDNGFEEYIVPAATWAVFSGEGAMPEAIQQLAMKIMTEWLPSSGYEYANTPEFELYLNDDVVNAKFEIWLPVTKKI